MRNALRVLLTVLMAFVVLASLAAQPAAAETDKLETKTEQKQPDAEDEVQGERQPEDPPDASPPNEHDPSEDDEDEQPESNENQDEPNDKDLNGPSDDDPTDPTDTSESAEDKATADDESSGDDEESSSADETQPRLEHDYICWWVFDSGCSRSRGSGYHDCGSLYIKEIGYTFNEDNSGYDSIQVVPTWYLRHVAGIVEDYLAWKAAENCITTYGPRLRVKSWKSIQQQFECHTLSPNGVATGPTWDLEGKRSANSNLINWLREACNWD